MVTSRTVRFICESKSDQRVQRERRVTDPGSAVHQLDDDMRRNRVVFVPIVPIERTISDKVVGKKRVNQPVSSSTNVLGQAECRASDHSTCPNQKSKAGRYGFNLRTDL